MLRELARAKINLTLDISGVRADGYHEVSMIMQSIELADELILKKIPHGITLSMDASRIDGGEKIPVDEKNLAWRAAMAFCEFCGKNFGVAIELLKKIPMAAGLAGGSTDAAAVIRGMNRLYETNFTEAQLCEIGARVGSDVPFCIVGGTCLAEGRGEILTRLAPMKNFSVVLAKPQGEISTAWSYKTYDAEPAESHPPNEMIIELLKHGQYSAAFKCFANVLESVALKKIPAIAEYKNKMLAAGARVALMSGSGATVFALADEANVDKISASIDDSAAQIFITKLFG
ncbi:MAG: 4-(cytidine 5'-diphospho)-2-C-methyl-D-erythritol kinase [Selenomonadaceae bacterium]|nr:4-(cytidine 5'-diphospho)-2-C-methyl-D-erythritol kinase [Selenomonadaceae bacterium]